MYRAATMARGALVPIIHDKTLALALSDANDAAALTLISTDIETITNGIVSLHELWATVVEIGIAVWLLERQLGVACVIPIVTSLGCHASIVHHFGLANTADYSHSTRRRSTGRFNWQRPGCVECIISAACF